MPAKTRPAKKTSKTAKSTKAKRPATVVSGSTKTGKWSWLGGRYGVLAFVALFAVCGVTFLAFSHAATGGFQVITVNAPPNAAGSLCISDQAGLDAQALGCFSSSGTTESWRIAGSTIQNFGGYCLQPTSTTKTSRVYAAVCNGSNIQKWGRPNWPGGVSQDLYNVAAFDLKPSQKNCLVDPGGTINDLEIVGCDTNAKTQNYADQKWFPGTFTGTTAPTPPKPAPQPPKGVSFSGSTSCYANTYTTANAGSVINCVGALQQMLNAIDGVFHGSGLGVDGQYGSLTATQVKLFQKYEQITQDGKAGPNTWSNLCGQIRGRGLTNTSTTTGKAYAYAECSRA